MLVLQNISKTYADKTALFPLSLTVEDGECLVLCGGNGAGKSTLIDILVGISEPSSGTVELNGVPLLEKRGDYLKQIAYMPDDFQMQDFLSCKEFLSFYGSFRKVPNEAILQALEQVGLLEDKDRLLKELSKGMRQRILLAQALLGDPEILFMDEPTNGLDPYWIDRFVNIIQAVNKKGVTIVFSTHMMDVAAELGSRIVFLDNGRVKKMIERDQDQSTEAVTLELMKLHRQAKSGKQT